MKTLNKGWFLGALPGLDQKREALVEAELKQHPNSVK